MGFNLPAKKRSGVGLNFIYTHKPSNFLEPGCLPGANSKVSNIWSRERDIHMEYCFKRVLERQRARSGYWGHNGGNYFAN